MSNPTDFEPGWFARDVNRASQQIRKWEETRERNARPTSMTQMTDTREGEALMRYPSDLRGQDEHMYKRGWDDAHATLSRQLAEAQGVIERMRPDISIFTEMLKSKKVEEPV